MRMNLQNMSIFKTFFPINNIVTNKNKVLTYPTPF